MLFLTLGRQCVINSTNNFWFDRDHLHKVVQKCSAKLVQVVNVFVNCLLIVNIYVDCLIITGPLYFQNTIKR